MVSACSFASRMMRVVFRGEAMIAPLSSKTNSLPQWTQRIHCFNGKFTASLNWPKPELVKTRISDIRSLIGSKLFLNRYLLLNPFGIDDNRHKLCMSKTYWFSSILFDKFRSLRWSIYISYVFYLLSFISSFCNIFFVGGCRDWEEKNVFRAVWVSA